MSLVLAAAGLGNTMSDVVGIFFGGYVELLADRMGLPQVCILVFLKPLRYSLLAEILTSRGGLNVRQSFEEWWPRKGLTNNSIRQLLELY